MKKEQIKKIPTKKPVSKQGSSLKKVDENKRYYWIGSAIIILLGFIIYSNSFDCSFQHDDFPNIVDNTSIQNISDVKGWWNFYPTRPIAVFTFAVNYYFHQYDVRYWHFVNLIIHLINAMLVWWLTLLIFSSPTIKNQKIAQNKKAIALITALLFVSHPLATQSVTYIVQRMSSMVAMFYLFSLIFYIKGRLTDKRKLRKYLLYLVTVVFAVLAMLTKENAFTLPLAIVLLEIMFVRTKKFTVNWKDYRMYLIIAGSIGIILILLSVIRFSISIFKPIPPNHGHDYTVTVLNYMLTQFSVIVKYIQLLILPVNQILSYDFPISNNFFDVRTFLSFIMLLSLLLLGVFLFNKQRIISFGIFWFFLTLAIESSIFPIEDVIFEHRTYLPSFGFFLILSVVIFLWLNDKNRFYLYGLVVLIVSVNSILTFERNKVWKTKLSLYNDNIKKAPNIAGPISARGDVYMEMGEYDKGIADYTKALKIYPKYTAVYSNRGIVYVVLQEWDKAIADFSMAISLDSNFVDAYTSRGIAFGRMGEWYNALSDFTKAIKLTPEVAKTYYNRGNACSNLRLWKNAISDYTKSIELEPNDKRVYTYRGIAYREMMQFDEAVLDFKQALQIDPYYELAITQMDSIKKHKLIEKSQ